MKLYFQTKNVVLQNVLDTIMNFQALPKCIPFVYNAITINFDFLCFWAHLHACVKSMLAAVPANWLVSTRYEHFKSRRGVSGWEGEVARIRVAGNLVQEFLLKKKSEGEG